ncbi:MAG: hypothetical protein LBT10_00455 [Methanobrevibacter sp.]|jgi:hypothetical protein|nr:hypothetical protein [Methanobrevibacter sp.]
MCLLYIFVEGDDDRRFFNNIKEELAKIININPKTIFIIPHVQKKDKIIDGYINKAKKSNNNYLFLSDRDTHHYPCITKKKDDLLSKYKSLEIDKIIVVEEAIESWYFSGLKNKSLFGNSKKLKYICSKKEFNDLIPTKCERVDFLNEILKFFDSKLAISNNDSYNYLDDSFHDPKGCGVFSANLYKFINNLNSLKVEINLCWGIFSCLNLNSIIMIKLLTI